MTAPNSPVQDRGLVILAEYRRRKEERDRFEALKRAILAGHPSAEQIEAQFPEFVPPDWREQIALARAGADSGRIDFERLDNDAVTWSVPQGDDERDALDRLIAEMERGTATAADMEGGWM